MSPAPLRAVLYLRLSLSSSDDVSDSIKRQETDLRALADREGWIVTKTLFDDGKSGRKRRANADEALAMLKDGEADVLAVWKFDRWSRQGISVLGDLVTTLDKNPRALFVAYMDGLRSSQSAWRIIAGVLSEVARMEAESTSVRVSSAHRSNREAGRFVGGTVPFGYQSAPREPDGRTLVPYDPEVGIIAEVAARLLSGESQAAILDDLVARKVPTTRSPARLARLRGAPADGLACGSWSYAGLTAIWTGESLQGRVSRSRTVTDDEGKTRKVWETLRGPDGLPLVAFPPLLDADTVQKLRAHLRDQKHPERKLDPERRTRQARLLSGVLYCDHCGKKLWVTAHGGRTVYSCARRAGVCTGPNMSADSAERAVTERFLGMAGGWPEVEEVEEVTAPDTVAALADVEASMREAQAELGDDYVDGLAILRRVELLKARRAELRALPSSVSVRTVQTGRTIAEAWEVSEVDDRRRMLLWGLDHVTLLPTESKGHTGYHPERLRFHMNEGVNFDALDYA